jgi:hypothetical protein
MYGRVRSQQREKSAEVPARPSSVRQMGQPAVVQPQSSAASALRFLSGVSPMRCQRPGVTQRKSARPVCWHQHEPSQAQRRRPTEPCSFGRPGADGQEQVDRDASQQHLAHVPNRTAAKGETALSPLALLRRRQTARPVVPQSPRKASWRHGFWGKPGSWHGHRVAPGFRRVWRGWLA